MDNRDAEFGGVHGQVLKGGMIRIGDDGNAVPNREFEAAIAVIETATEANIVLRVRLQ